MAHMESSQGGSEHPLNAEESGPSCEQPASHENTEASYRAGSGTKRDDPFAHKFLSELVSEDSNLNWKWRLFSWEDRSRGATKRWWPALRSNVLGFVHELIPQIVTTDMFGPEVKARLSWIAEGRAEFYIRTAFGSSDMSFRISFFETWLWHVLYDSLFSRDCKDKWREGPWAGFGSILNDMQDKVQHVENEFTSSFFASRQFTTRLLHLHHGYHSDPNRLKTILLQHFGSFILAKNPPYSVLEHTLDELVDTALRMDLAMLGTRLDIRVEMTDPGTGLRHGFGFVEHSEYMEIRSGIYGTGSNSKHGRHVDFVSFPMLRTYGKQITSHWGNAHMALFERGLVMSYDIDTVDCRMGVVLGKDFVDPLPPQRQPPTDEQQGGGSDDNDDDDDDNDDDDDDDGGDTDNDGGKADEDGAGAEHDDGNAYEAGGDDEQLPDSDEQLPDSDEQLPDNDQQLPDSPEQLLPDDDEALDAVQPAGEWSVDAQPETNEQSGTDEQTHGDGHAGHTEQEAKPWEMKYRLRRQKRVDYTFAGMGNKRRLI